MNLKGLLQNPWLQTSSFIVFISWKNEKNLNMHALYAVENRKLNWKEAQIVT